MSKRNILMVAAENGAFPGGKVGGIGDVIRDVPTALANQGSRVDVLMPGYQHFSKLPGSREVSEVKVRFRGRTEILYLFEITPAEPVDGVRHWVLEHSLLAPAGPGRIYCDDAPERPFATDASKFALFCAGVAQVIVSGAIARHEVIHLHDWHAALVAVLAAYHPAYPSIMDRRLVYTIHNLALQGIRPFQGDESSLGRWFPELKYEADVIRDPRYADCVNPTRAAISLCHRVHTVSPTYAEEIQRPTVEELGFVGGEGLERSLQQAAEDKRLVGILNGCNYDGEAVPGISFEQFLSQVTPEVIRWMGRERYVAAADMIAVQRLQGWQAKDEAPSMILTSVGRLTDQKVRLLRETLDDGRTSLEHLLEKLATHDAVLLMLGSGDPGIEDLLTRIAAAHGNFLFLKGYSEEIADHLYGLGDLFLMPSSFEPCGISQMLAMRAGQPCLVHAVGGLADTVDDKVGFPFRGKSPGDQARAMLATVDEALDVKLNDGKHWSRLRTNASKLRYDWSQSAKQYARQLYD